MDETSSKTFTTIAYWRRLLQEANLEENMLEHMAKDRLSWRNIVLKRIEHIEEYERQKGHQYNRPENTPIITERNIRLMIPTIPTCNYPGCGRSFKSKGGLTIHQKRIHRDQSTAPTFKCDKCGDILKQEATLKNHYKNCVGGKDH